MTSVFFPGRTPVRMNIVTKSRSFQLLGADEAKTTKAIYKNTVFKNTVFILKLFLEYPELLFHLQRKIFLK